MDYSACVVSNDFEDPCEGGVDGGPVVGEGGAGRSRALHQGRLARRRGRLSGPLLGRYAGLLVPPGLPVGPLAGRAAVLDEAAPATRLGWVAAAAVGAQLNVVGRFLRFWRGGSVALEEGAGGAGSHVQRVFAVL